MENNPIGLDLNSNSGSYTSNSGDKSWVIYRLPGEEMLYYAAGSLIKTNLSQINGNGFVIAPFHQPDGKIYYLQAAEKLMFSNSELHNQDFQPLPFYHLTDLVQPSTMDHYCEMVRKALNGIESGLFTKVVPARTEIRKLKVNFDLIAIYQALLEAYPNAFVYILSSPETGTWVGCSPELLVRSSYTTIQTLALAGTRKLNSGKNVPEYDAFTPKEFEEQAIVTRYILSILEKYCTDIQHHGPELLQAGNVLHLATHISGQLPQEYKKSLAAILSELHPTPAVCGLPLQDSLEFLRANEGFNRELYSGYVGPITDIATDLFVNLRCMQIKQSNQAVLYAGAGVVSGSDPEKEWLETEEKMQTLLRYL